MYVPPSFRIDDVAACHALMRAHGFATLITTVRREPPQITHLPLIVDAAGEFGTLRGHLARANPHWQAFADGETTVAIFHGPHGYISPRWYAAPVAVPTWNYVAIHAHGRPVIVEDADAIRGHLTELAERYETGSDPWRPTELPDDVYEKLSASIVCFAMPIARLEGKAKLGQNRSEADRAGMLAALDAISTGTARQLAEITRAR